MLLSVRMNADDNPLLQPRWMNQTYCRKDISGVITGSNYQFFTGSPPGSAVNNMSLKIPFDTSGVHFTGLSYASTLTVNVRWLIERMPGPRESDLVVLATPSASYDPLALELYTRCLGDMPPGVMLSENPLGEWFRSALSKVADWAPKIGNVVGNFIPGASAFGNVIGGLAGAGQKLIPKSESDKHKQKAAAARQLISLGSGKQKIPKLKGSASTARMETE